AHGPLARRRRRNRGWRRSAGRSGTRGEQSACAEVGIATGERGFELRRGADRDEPQLELAFGRIETQQVGVQSFDAAIDTREVDHRAWTNQCYELLRLARRGQRQRRKRAPCLRGRTFDQRKRDRERRGNTRDDE